MTGTMTQEAKVRRAALEVGNGAQTLECKG